MHIYSISADDRGQRLDKYIKRLLPQAPSSFIYKMLRRKNIVLNGKRAQGNEIVAMGDEVRMYLSDETIGAFGGAVHGVTQTEPRSTFSPVQTAKGTAQTVTAAAASERMNSRSSGSGEGHRAHSGMQTLLDARQISRGLSRRYPSLRIIYEDRDIAAAFKPAGVLSQKASADDLSLNEWFLGLLLERGEVSPASLRMFTPSVQNRLDRNTEGLVLLAKTLQGSHILTSLQREHLLRKFYIMVVCGQVTKSGRIEGWLARDRASNRVQMFEEERPGTVWSATSYRPVAAHEALLRRDGASSRRCYLTGLEAELLTGRTHQLRAHMAWTGHPILGDPKYGDPDVNLAFRSMGVTAQLLICQRIVFPDGMEDEFSHLSGRIIEVPLPQVYLRVMGEN